MTRLEQKHLALLGKAQRLKKPDTDNMRLCFEVLALASAIDRACAARLAPHRLSEGKFVLLFLLSELPEGLAPHELAERAGVTRATITGLLDGLERDGFLSRHEDQADRRKVSVRLTEKGQTMALDRFHEHSQWISSLFAGFDQQEREALERLLLRAWRNVEGLENNRAAVAAGTPL
ncbi:DNA-binding MarR family transcriptional regulator [Deinobacterium chartae]|uniref:DNA-binding MarR family transcriptional regulator n=1 Tax=Deinobacterium chartae TaxID=521158 RepID=A0A841HYD1_9DEIO|nr:MarR family transcriptional regulator [Deinobacterium chartae]MBB6098407.1 DNA-binding MarR family transcriptional regulator [Deinobacterium chartae]